MNVCFMGDSKSTRWISITTLKDFIIRAQWSLAADPDPVHSVPFGL